MDINGGQTPAQTVGNPIWPGAVSTGPLLAGNVVHSDGSGVLARVGEQSGIANQGYVEMVQFADFTQAGSTSALSTPIVIPAQSMITTVLMFVTTAWTGGSTTISVKDTAGNTYAASVAGGTIGVVSGASGSTKSVIKQWENVGDTDVQITVTSGNTGSGAGILAIRYVQGCNAPTTA